MKRIEIGVAILIALSAAMRSGGAQPAASTEAHQQSYQLEQSQDYAGAIRVLLPIHEASNRDYLVNLRLGWLYYLSGAYANSRQHYQAAISASPQAIDPRLGLLLPLLAQGRYADAEVAAREALRLDASNYYGNLRLAYALRMQLKFSPADQTDRRMLQLYPVDTKFLLEDAYCQLGLKHAEEAQRSFHRVLELDPQNADATRALEAGKAK